MNDEVKQKYTEVSRLLDDALNSTKFIELQGEEENAELSAIKSTLESMNKSFKDEIEKLESSSEWDKLCIACFGETNAGKSTLIESLRIIYNEESRLIESNDRDKEFKTLLEKNSKEYNDILKKLEDVNKAVTVYFQDLEAAKIKNRIKNVIFAFLFMIIGLISGIIFF